MSCRVLVADDHESFADGICALLATKPGFEVAGKATDGKQAVRLCRERQAGLVIMDLSMPEMSGIEATRRITSEQPAVKVLCLSMHADRGYVMGALDAGACGYMLKGGPKGELLHALRIVLADQVYLSPAIAGTVAPVRPGGKRFEALPKT